MTTNTSSARQGQPLSMRFQNGMMRRLLSLPFSTPISKQLLLAEIVGRKSGVPHRVPVSYVREGETLLSPGGGSWKFNLLDGRPAILRVDGKRITATGELIEDPTEVERLLEFMVEKSGPRVLSVTQIERGADGRLDHAQLDAALQRGFRMVRWSPKP